MFGKSLFSLATVVLVSSQVSAHALVSPVLGVNGQPKRGDVKRPSNNAPCGQGVNIAADLANIKAADVVAAAADGTFTVKAINFNGGKDGSRAFTLTVDADGNGKDFVAGTIVKNGDAAPNNETPQDIVAKLPPGTKCTAGKDKNLCLASFKNLSGFGNCVAVSQGAAAASIAQPAAQPAAPAAVPPPPAVAQPAKAGEDKLKKVKTGAKEGAAKEGAKEKEGAGEKAKEKQYKDKAKAKAEAAAAKQAEGAAQANAQAGAQANAVAGAEANAPAAAVAGTVAGTRAARALLSDIEARGEAALRNVRRGLVGWIWA